jgi:hypothetical protein
MTEPGRKKRNHDPGFDETAEQVAQRHEDRREVIAENVEEQRQEDLDNAENYRENREAQRIQRADDLEVLTLHRLRIIALIAAAAAVIAIGVAAAALISANRITKNSQEISRLNGETFKTLRSAEFRICERVQLIRDQINGVNLLVFDTFDQVVHQQRELLKSKKLTPLQRTMTRQSLHRAEGVTKTSVVTGPTDCKQATDNPLRYVPPAPSLISRDGKRVNVARHRYSIMITKAKKGEPLYKPGP